MDTSAVGWLTPVGIHATRSGMRRTLGAMPASPIALSTIAPTRPATAVPWPAKSLGSLSAVSPSSPVARVVKALATKSQPAKSSTKPLLSSSTPGRPLTSAQLRHICPLLPATVPPRSGWYGSTPVSMIATTIEVSPSSTSHASVARVSWRGSTSR